MGVGDGWSEHMEKDHNTCKLVKYRWQGMAERVLLE